MFAPLTEKNKRDLRWGYHDHHDHDEYDCDGGDWGWLYTHNRDTHKYEYWKATHYWVKGYNEEEDDDAYYWKHCHDGKLINKAYPGYALSWSGYYGWLKLVHYKYGVAWTYSDDYQFKAHYHGHYYCADLYRDSGGWYHVQSCYDDWADQVHYWDY